jgi:hypothetical protein
VRLIGGAPGEVRTRDPRMRILFSIRLRYEGVGGGNGDRTRRRHLVRVPAGKPLLPPQIGGPDASTPGPFDSQN